MDGYYLMLPRALVARHTIEELIAAAAATTIVRPLRLYLSPKSLGDGPPELLATIQ